jgi:CHAT domain
MDGKALLEILQQQQQINAVVLAVGAAAETGDTARELEGNLTVATLSETSIALMEWQQVVTADVASRHLSMAADTLFNQNRIAEMDPVEARATALADRWCSPQAALALRHDQALRARQRGRFAVALAAFAELRDAAEAAGFEEFARKATLARAETLQWLGDPGRALEELDRLGCPEAPTSTMVRDANPSVERMRAAAEAGALEQLKGMQAATAAMAAITTWHLFRFLCLRDLAERDPDLRPAAAAELAAITPQYRAMGYAAATDFFEAQLMLGGGEAEQSLSKTEDLAERFAAKSIFRHRQGSVATIRAQALLALGRSAEARAAAREGAEMLTAAGQEENVWRAWMLLARATDDPAERSAALVAGVAAVERMRLAPLGWRLDNLYLASRMNLYEAAIIEACRAGDGLRALGLIEAVKSRTLTAILGAERDGVAKANPDLVRQHAELDAMIAKTQADVIAGTPPEGAAQMLQEKRRERAELAERLRQADPTWRTLTAPDPVPPTAIAAAVQSLGAVALDLFLDNNVLTVVLVTQGVIQVDRQDLAPQTLQALERLLQGLSPPPLEDGTLRPPDPRVRDPAQLGLSLDAFLPPDMATKVSAAERVLIAAHGALHLLSWPVLPVTPGGQRLIETAEVGLLPNLSCVPMLAARAAGTAWCAAIGAPERGFGPEDSRRIIGPAATTATKVAALYAARNQLVAPPAIGRDATISAFDALCTEPRSAGAILHVTSHGEPPRSEPGDAALLLADANLEAAAISRASLPFAEVVLSACSTGFRPTAEAQGIRLWGDDALGLPGAFIEAGVAALLVSIPLAEIGAANRMAIDYHTARLAGEPPLAAFRTAQRALLSDPAIRVRNACGFVLYGCR